MSRMRVALVAEGLGGIGLNVAGEIFSKCRQQNNDFFTIVTETRKVEGFTSIYFIKFRD